MYDTGIHNFEAQYQGTFCLYLDTRPPIAEGSSGLNLCLTAYFCRGGKEERVWQIFSSQISGNDDSAPSPDYSVQIAFSSGWAVRVAVKGKVFCPPVLSAVSSGCWEIRAGMLRLCIKRTHINLCTFGLLVPIMKKYGIPMQRVHPQASVKPELRPLTLILFLQVSCYWFYVNVLMIKCPPIPSHLTSVFGLRVLLSNY